MNKITKSLLALCLIMMVGLVQAQNAETILKKHFEAVGQEALVKKKSMLANGQFSYEAFGLQLPMKMYIMRPNKIRVEGTFQNQPFVQAFDGKNGWLMAPWLGGTPQDLDAGTLRQIRDLADIDGLLYNYQDKGFELSYEGTETAEGNEAYKLKLTKADGASVLFLINTSTYLVIKQIAQSQLKGQPLNSEVVMTDYRKVDGVTFAHKWVTKANGQTVAAITFDTLSFDEAIDESIFNKPDGE